MDTCIFAALVSGCPEYILPVDFVGWLTAFVHINFLKPFTRLAFCEHNIIFFLVCLQEQTFERWRLFPSLNLFFLNYQTCKSQNRLDNINCNIKCFPSVAKKYSLMLCIRIMNSQVSYGQNIFFGYFPLFLCIFKIMFWGLESVLVVRLKPTLLSIGRDKLCRLGLSMGTDYSPRNVGKGNGKCP